MSPPSPPERSHLPISAPYSSGRRSTTSYSTSQSARPSEYSSLGDALGGVRQPQPQYLSDYPPPSSAAGSSVPQHPHVSSEGRYPYNPSGMATYDYPFPSSYDTPAHYAQSSLPPMRSVSPAAHPPPPQSTSHYNPTPTSYSSTYPQPHYAPVPSSSQQWEDHSWEQAPHSFTPEAADVFSVGRGDLVASPQADPRSYITQQYSSAPVGGRSDERSMQQHNTSPLSKGKARERDPPPPSRPQPVAEFRPAPIDFIKLLNTYDQILSGCTTLLESQPKALMPERPWDSIDRMLRSANLGSQMLSEAVSSGIPQDRRPSGDSSISTELENLSPEIAPQRPAEPAPEPEGQKCLGCGATSTPEWRRGPLGPRTLCNACGLVYAKLIKKRSRDLGSNSITAPGAPQSHPAPTPAILEEGPSFPSPNNGDSDDELSYGSQDPH